MRNKIHTLGPNSSPLKQRVKQSASAQVQPRRWRECGKFPGNHFQLCARQDFAWVCFRDLPQHILERPLPYPLCFWKDREYVRMLPAETGGLEPPSQGSFPMAILPFLFTSRWVGDSQHHSQALSSQALTPNHTHVPRGFSGRFASLPSEKSVPAVTGTKTGFIISFIAGPRHAWPGAGPSHKALWKCLHTDF